ncbi:hypothetical protein F4777DRAFT_540346 [Nemania sp. FL0916]|nr:hypothetical protein F4777DRAFT_540346 [Nemania sp. FL0916]
MPPDRGFRKKLHLDHLPIRKRRGDQAEEDRQPLLRRDDPQPSRPQQAPAINPHDDDVQRARREKVPMRQTHQRPKEIHNSKSKCSKDRRPMTILKRASSRFSSSSKFIDNNSDNPPPWASGFRPQHSKKSSKGSLGDSNHHATTSEIELFQPVYTLLKEFLAASEQRKALHAIWEQGPEPLELTGLKRKINQHQILENKLIHLPTQLDFKLGISLGAAWIHNAAGRLAVLEDKLEALDQLSAAQLDVLDNEREMRHLFWARAAGANTAKQERELGAQNEVMQLEVQRLTEDLQRHDQKLESMYQETWRVRAEIVRCEEAEMMKRSDERRSDIEYIKYVDEVERYGSGMFSDFGSRR